MASGHIRRRGKKWVVVIDGPKDPVTGERRQHWHSYKTKKEAEQARARLIHEVDTGRYVEQSRVTIGEFMDDWLLSIEGTVRDSTRQTYGLLVRVHVTPNIGNVRVQRLTTAKLDALYQRLRTEGKKSQRSDGKFSATGGEDGSAEDVEKRGLSAKTVRNIHIVIHKALDYAVANNLVAKNVADVANAPKPARLGEHEMKTWDVQQLRQFLSSVESHRYYTAYVLVATTGMRRGEILGLRWEDVDLERGELSVRQTLTSFGYKMRFSPPKTKKSRRCIPLDKKTVAFLKAHRARQTAERLAMGPEYVDTGLVFTREDGALIHPDRFSHVFDELVKKANLPKIRFHDIRHTYATLALQQGVNIKVLSERLGHSSAAFTMDIYQHVAPVMKQEAAEVVAEAVFGT